MITLNINGKRRQLDAPNDMPLLWALRDILGLTGTKFGCGLGLCGACTVHIEGAAARSCITPLSSVAGKAITTIEGVGKTRAGAAVQKAWLADEVLQCGYCQSGQIMAVVAFLKNFAKPTDADIDANITNICRCGTYEPLRRAIHRAADMMKA